MVSDPAQMLEASGVRWVRILWCDNANVIRAKAVHTTVGFDYFKHGVGVTTAAQALPVMADAVVAASGLGPVGEVRLIPDWSTFTPLPYAPGHARVMGDFMSGGRPWVHCPRHFLRRMLAEAGREGITVRAAFENEFYLLRTGPDGIEPVDESVFAATLGMDQSRPVIDEIAEALLTQEIPVEQYYPESGPGQHELTVRHAEPIAAADHQIAFRETAHAVALRHGLKASFLPKIFADKAGSGCHLHLSLWHQEQNLMGNPQKPGALSDKARAFMAGILQHLPALMAVTTPSANSYRRFQPHFWSGAFRCWGFDNREAALRVPSGADGGAPTNVELKTVDASSNPYLALGAVLAAGLDGLHRALTLPPPVDVDPGNLSDAERRTRGVDRLPANLGEALEHFSHDPLLLGALGHELAQAYLTVRWTEWEAMKGMELAHEVKLLLERY
jgi:glutamine synthetase